MKSSRPAAPSTNHAPTLKLVRLAIDTYHENVVYLHRDCEVYRTEGFQALSKVRICGNGQRILAVLNVVDDDRIVLTDQLALSEQAFNNLELEEGELVTVEHAEPRFHECRAPQDRW